MARLTRCLTSDMDRRMSVLAIPSAVKDNVEAVPSGCLVRCSLMTVVGSHGGTFGMSARMASYTVTLLRHAVMVRQSMLAAHDAVTYPRYGMALALTSAS